MKNIFQLQYDYVQCGAAWVEGRESNFAIRSKLGDFIELEDAQSQFHDPAEEENY